MVVVLLIAAWSFITLKFRNSTKFEKIITWPLLCKQPSNNRKLIMTASFKKIVKSVLTGLLVLLLIFSASDKLIGSEHAQKLAGLIGISPSMYRVLGIIELCSALLFAFARTGILGMLLLSSYFGGAIATRLQHQENILLPVVIVAFIWIIAVMRFPELSSRISRKLSN